MPTRPRVIYQCSEHGRLLPQDMRLEHGRVCCNGCDGLAVLRYKYTPPAPPVQPRRGPRVRGKRR